MHQHDYSEEKKYTPLSLYIHCCVPPVLEHKDEHACMKAMCHTLPPHLLESVLDILRPLNGGTLS